MEPHKSAGPRDAFEKIRTLARHIQKIAWGYDGDCGANRFADEIEEITDEQIAAPGVTASPKERTQEYFDGLRDGIEQAYKEAETARCPHNEDPVDCPGCSKERYEAYVQKAMNFKREDKNA